MPPGYPGRMCLVTPAENRTDLAVVGVRQDNHMGCHTQRPEVELCSGCWAVAGD